MWEPCRKAYNRKLSAGKIRLLLRPWNSCWLSRQGNIFDIRHLPPCRNEHFPNALLLSRVSWHLLSPLSKLNFFINENRSRTLPTCFSAGTNSIEDDRLKLNFYSSVGTSDFFTKRHIFIRALKNHEIENGGAGKEIWLGRLKLKINRSRGH